MSIQLDARARGFAVVAIAAIVSLFAAGDLLRGVPRPGLVLAARGAWVAVLLILGVVVLGRGERRARLAEGVAALVSIGALAILAWADGGSATGSLAFLVTAPLFIAVILPDSRLAAWSSLASLAAVVTVAVALGRAPHESIALGARAAVAGAFAFFGSALHERARRAEIALALERARAVEALSVVGSEASVVAHDMSGPIAAIKGNLGWLAEAAEGGRLHAEEADVRDALRDARAAADALVAAVGKLRETAVDAKRAAPPAGPDRVHSPATLPEEP